MNSTMIDIREGMAYLPPVDEQPVLKTVDLRPYGLEAALYVNEWNEVVAYFDTAQGNLREQALMYVATYVLEYAWNINRSLMPQMN